MSHSSSLSPLFRGLVFLSLLITTAAWAEGKFLKAQSDGLPGQYIVVLDPRSLDGPRRGAAIQAGGELPSRDRMQQVRRATLDEVAAALLQEHGGTILKRWSRVLPALLLRLDENAARSLAEDPRVAVVEQDRTLERAFAEDPALASQSIAPDSIRREIGPNATNQPILNCSNPVPPAACTDNWGLDRIDATSALPRNESYAYDATGFGVHVYVFDHGVRKTHTQFGGRVLDGIGPTSIDGDHGTRVASVIGGSQSGVAKNVYIHPVRLGTTTSEVLDRFEGIVAHRVEHHIGPAVINTSWNIPKLSSDPRYVATSHAGCISMAARNVVEQFEIPLVVSAGNRDTSPLDFSPSDLGFIDGVIVVGGSAHDDTRWTRKKSDSDYGALCANPLSLDCGSNRGPGIDLWAPAEWIYTATGDTTAGSTLSGTSFAAPHTTGVVALYLQQNPDAKPWQVEAAIRAQALVGKLADIGSSPNLLLNTRAPLIQNLSQPIAPTPRDDYASTMVDVAVSVPVLYNDLDRNSNSLSLSGWTQGAHGQVAPDPQCSTCLRYTPANNYTGSDSFTYTVTDTQQTGTATVHLQIDRDQPPFALPDHRTMALPSGSPLIILTNSLLNNDQDDTQGANFVSHTVPPGFGGTLTLIDFRLEFTPHPPFGDEHTYRFTYTMMDTYTGNDGTSHRDNSDVYITTFRSSGSGLPVAVADFAYVAPDPVLPVIIELLANDTDNGTLTLAQVTLPQDGTLVSILPTGVSYRPNPGFSGYDGFTYVIRDNQGNLAASTVTVKVGGNRPPAPRHDGLRTAVGASLTIPFASLVQNDRDPDGDSLHVDSWTNPDVGYFTLAGPTAFTYVPPPTFIGNARFQYTVTDDRGGFSTATVVVQVGEPTADLPPVGGADTILVPAGSLRVMFNYSTLIANDSDPEGAGAYLCGEQDLPLHGVLATHRGYVYVPGPSFWTAGVDHFRYRLNDRSDCSGLMVPVQVTLQAGAAGGIVFSDAFTASSGSPLDSRLTDIGQRIWDASPAAVLSGNVVTASGSVVGGVPVVPNSISADSAVTVAGSLSVHDSTWAALGFSRTSQGPFWNDGQLWVLLRPSGAYVVQTTGTAAPIGSGTVPGWSSEQKDHRVELTYDAATRQASAKIDGITVVSWQSLASVPDLQFAGFQFFNGTSESTRLDDFEVRVTPSPFVSNEE